MSDAIDPTIAFIIPSKVAEGWTGSLTVTGQNFNEQSAVMIDGDFPVTTYVRPFELGAVIDGSITSTAGDKSVKVHQLDTGSLSNEVFLTVEPK